MPSGTVSGPKERVSIGRFTYGSSSLRPSMYVTPSRISHVSPGSADHPLDEVVVRRPSHADPLAEPVQERADDAPVLRRRGRVGEHDDVAAFDVTEAVGQTRFTRIRSSGHQRRLHRARRDEEGLDQERLDDDRDRRATRGAGSGARARPVGLASRRAAGSAGRIRRRCRRSVRRTGRRRRPRPRPRLRPSAGCPSGSGRPDRFFLDDGPSAAAASAASSIDIG